MAVYWSRRDLVDEQLGPRLAALPAAERAALEKMSLSENRLTRLPAAMGHLDRLRRCAPAGQRGLATRNFPFHPFFLQFGFGRKHNISRTLYRAIGAFEAA